MVYIKAKTSSYTGKCGSGVTQRATVAKDLGAPL